MSQPPIELADFEDAAIATDHPSDQSVRAQVTHIEALGYEVIAYFELDAKPVISQEALELTEDQMAAAEQNSTRVHARFHPTTGVRPNDIIEAAVSMENAHFFDLETGLAIRD